MGDIKKGKIFSRIKEENERLRKKIQLAWEKSKEISSQLKFVNKPLKGIESLVEFLEQTTEK